MVGVGDGTGGALVTGAGVAAVWNEHAVPAIVATDGVDGFVVAWRQFPNCETVDWECLWKGALYARRIDAAGLPMNIERVLSDETKSIGITNEVALASWADGRIVAVWLNDKGGSVGIHGAVLTSSLEPIGSFILEDQCFPERDVWALEVATAASGRALVAWTEESKCDFELSDPSVTAQWIDQKGEVVSSPFPVDSQQDTPSWSPSITMSGGDTYWICWTAEGTDSKPTSVRLQERSVVDDMVLCDSSIGGEKDSYGCSLLALPGCGAAVSWMVTVHPLQSLP